jgi:undecaprenyl-diphosphatase
LTLDTLLELDRSLFLYFNGLGSSTWDGLWLTITNKLTFVPLYALLLFLIYKNYGLRPLLMMMLVIAVMITFTDQITNVFKNGFMRPRPCQLQSLLDEGMRFIAERCGKYGFFSGHSSNSMAAAVFGGLVLRPFFKRLIFFLILWSFIVAYSRVYVGVHYPLDIICGMAFGALSGVTFFKLNSYLLHRFISN